MKKFVAAFMAALMMVAVLAAPAKAVDSVRHSQEKSLGTTIEIHDADLSRAFGGDGYRGCAIFAAAATFGILTGGAGFGVSLVVGGIAASQCGYELFGH